MIFLLQARARVKSQMFRTAVGMYLSCLIATALTATFAEHSARQAVTTYRGIPLKGANNNIVGNNTETTLAKRNNTQAKFLRDAFVHSSDEAECVLKLRPKCVDKFRHVVYYSEASFVYLQLFNDTDVSITGGKEVVGANLWVWTFYGKEGGLEFLNWPMEFGIWSLGLLTSFVVKKPQKMLLMRKEGNCTNLEVGVEKDDEIISNALKSLGEEMMNFDREKYGPSFYCYKTRKYIHPEFAYVLCKHIVCPVEALRYNCCRYYFNTTIQNRTISCTSESFEYELFSWVLPTVASVILFALSPLVLMYVCHSVADGKQLERRLQRQFKANTDSDSDTQGDEKIILLNEHHQVTLSKTLFAPIKQCCVKLNSSASRPCKRLYRVLLPIFSLTIIGLQVFLDYFFLHDFVLTSLSKGVPMGFRSVIAGYRGSKTNFLPYLGGPFVAVSIYLFITSFMLLLPASVSGLLLTGIQGNEVDESKSPLMLKLCSVEHLGSKVIRHTRGFYKLYCIFSAHFFMLINTNFWKHAFSVQLERWKRINICTCMLFLLPPYFIFCVLELILCVAFYGFPIVSFGFLIVKAYCGRLLGYQTRQRLFFRILRFFLTIITTACVVYFLFMFCTIFMDAILFFSRVAMFTFTGIVIYPKVSYGYIIFAFTVVYYIWQSVQDYALIYHRLLKDTIGVTDKLQRANDSRKLVVKVGDFKGITESLFEHVIERHYPRRKQVFISALKVTIVLTVLGLLINTLIETDGFRELHVIMHVGTALFICALPQICRSMCRGTGNKFRQKRFRRELEESINTFIGYTYDDFSSCDSE